MSEPRAHPVPPAAESAQLSAREARALALRAQGFGDRSLTAARPIRLLERLGVVQLDSVNVLARNHELVPFARVGRYSLEALTTAIYARRQGFEYWAHEASWLPMADYRYFLPRMERMRAHGRGWWQHVRAEHGDLYPRVLDRVRTEGPLTAADFEDPRTGRGSWWDWKPAKLVLEDLFDQGLLMARDRVRGFARLYDLPERVLPPRLDLSNPGAHEAARYFLRRGLAALGVATAAEAADYYRLRHYPWRPALDSLVQEGAVRTVTVEGWRAPGYVLPETLDGPLRLPRHRPTFLAPFDNLIWERGRLERLFGFRYRVEIYVPEAKRQYGYYVLPLLARASLRGRADVKFDRPRGVLRVRGLWLEGAEPEEVQQALTDLAAHLGATAVEVERTITVMDATESTPTTT